MILFSKSSQTFSRYVDPTIPTFCLLQMIDVQGDLTDMTNLLENEKENAGENQCFCFQNKTKYFFGYFDPGKIFLHNKNKLFPGGLTDISARKKQDW